MTVTQVLLHNLLTDWNTAHRERMYPHHPSYYDSSPVPQQQETEERGPIYNSTITKKGWALRAYFAVVVIMVASAMIYCLVETVRVGIPVLILLMTNMTMSSAIGLVLVWWYRLDALGDDKLWYLILLGMLIIFQCITADVFVDHARDVYKTNPTPTFAPTTHAPTANPTTNLTRIS